MSAELKERNEMIVEAWKKGYSYGKIAEMFHLSRPTVFTIVKRTVPNWKRR